MTVNLKEKSWYIKYQPTKIDELIFDNDEFKALVTMWVENEDIDGNVLFYGPHGLGKSSTSEILIRTIIKAQNDLLVVKNRGVDYIDDVITPYIKSGPIRSKKKIIYIEEVDKMSPQAQTTLKDGPLEKFQQNATFICCTNYIKKILPALVSRFNYKVSFTGANISGNIERLRTILINEDARFDETQLEEFVKTNSHIGMRELINYIQYMYMSNNKIVEFKKIADKSTIEENIVQIILRILNQIATSDIKTKRLCCDAPDMSPIKEDYKTLTVLLHNNPEINYELIYERLINISTYIPIKLICGKYADGNDHKTFPHLNIIGCLYECMKCLGEIHRW